MRSTLLKKFQVRQNHLGYWINYYSLGRHLNKRIHDNLREYQIMELRHVKERFELEMMYFEEIENNKIIHENRNCDLLLRQMNEMHTEKEFVLGKKEAAKEAQLIAKYAKELKHLQYEQKVALRQLSTKQNEK